MKDDLQIWKLILKELRFRQEFCTDGAIFFEGNGLKI